MEVLICLVLELLVDGVLGLLGEAIGPRGERPAERIAVSPAPLRAPVPARRPQVVVPGYETRLGKGTHCLVCGDSLERNVVSCPTCATLHHQDCWDYLRGCSTYGCSLAGRRRAG
jgi:hypothetical protein